MIKHIVMFRLLDNAGGHTKSENLAEAVARASKLKELVPTIRDMSVVTDINAVDANYDIALICDFDDADGLAQYQVHPDHKAFGGFITPLRELRACIDYEY